MNCDIWFLLDAFDLEFPFAIEFLVFCFAPWFGLSFIFFPCQIHAEIRRFQQERYRLQSISYLQEYLSRLDQMSEEDCYAMSLELQPKKAN